jgi:hypothetical protein
MVAGKVLKVLVPAALIVIVVAAGFAVPLFIPAPTVSAVNGTVGSSADVQYAVFAGSCSYAETVETVPMSHGRLSVSLNSSLLRSVNVNCGAWADIYSNWVAGGAYTDYYDSPSDYLEYVSLMVSESWICDLARAGGGSCGWDGNPSDFIPTVPPTVYLTIPVSIIGVNYMVSTHVTLNNELPLTIEKVTASESSGNTVNVEFNETSCAKDCSLTMKIESYSSNESTVPIKIGLSILTNSAAVWGFPFWWVRIGTTSMTISAALEINLSNSTVSLL